VSTTGTGMLLRASFLPALVELLAQKAESA
jgi:hypothetical protein